MRIHELVGRRELRCDACRWRLVRNVWLGDALDEFDGDEPINCPLCGEQLTEAVYDRHGTLVMDRWSAGAAPPRPAPGR